MTNKQFDGFIRFLLDSIKEVKEEQNEEKRNQRLDKSIEKLQNTLEY